MAGTDYNKVYINNVVFEDVTNKTVCGRVFTFEEAYASTLKREISTNRANKEEGR